MNKSFLGNQNDMAEGKTTLHEQICCQEMLLGFPEVKMASSKPQVVDLFSHPLGIKRNGICNYQRPNKMGKTSIWQQFNFKKILGVSCGKKWTQQRPKNHAYLQFTGNPKTSFWASRKKEKCIKMWGKLPTCSQGKKRPPQTPKSWPLSSHSPRQHQKRILHVEKGRKRQPNCGGDSSLSYCCMREPKLHDDGWEMKVMGA